MRIPESIALLAAVPAVLVGMAAPAAADAADQASEPEANYTFTMYEGETTTGGVLGKVTLECFPAGGTHPAPAEACDALENVRGDFELLPTGNAMCLTHWDPVTVVARGEGFGRVVDFEETYSNRTCASAGSDRIFRFA